ncbi:MAG: retropepsin-like aspartic protease [Minisyncoccota bacterium]
MAWVEYPYTSLWNQNGILKKPMIEVEVSKDGQSFTQVAIIDSGADITVMSAEVAEAIGIDTEICEKKFVSGIGGELQEGFSCDIDLKVDGFQKAVTIPVLFVPGLQFNYLLGQYGFFEQFHVRFYKDQDTFSLMKAPRKKKQNK